MIALGITSLVAIWLVTGQFSWLLFVVAVGVSILLIYRQWLELGVVIILCGQLLFLPPIDPLEIKQERQTMQFVILSIPTATTTGCRAYGETATGAKWLVTQKTTTCQLTYGAETIAEVIPTPISGLQNFHLFNRQQFYTRQKRVHGELQVQNVLDATIENKRYQQQHRLLSWLEHRIQNREAQILFQTMVLGETSQFDDEVRSVWQSLNISHILAISGLHAAIFIGLLRVVLRRLSIYQHWQPWLIGGCLLILRWYNFASVSFSRVVCMWFISLLLGKNWNQYQKLLFACALIALIWPEELLGLGFYYSFACAFLLILGHKLWRGKYQWLLVPLTLQLWLLPVTLWQTGGFLPISLVANIFAIPFISILLPCLLIMPFIPASAEWVVSFYRGGAAVFDWLAQTFPWSLQFGQLTLLSCLLVLFALYLVYRTYEHQSYRRMVVASLLLCLVLTSSGWRRSEVTLLDIGQGDASIIIDQRRKAFVIDTGGPSQLQSHHLEREPVVEAYLKQRGVTTIETLVITHGDLDHMGYALALFNRESIKIENLVLATIQEFSPEEQQLLQLAQRAGTQIHFVQAGQQIKFGNHSFDVLSPTSDIRADMNNHSIVLWTRIGGLAWLFTGDIEASIERTLIEQYPHLPVDVLKVAHHGSKTSSSLLFLLSFQPQYALISAGKNNRFNHPHPTIIQRLTEQGIANLVTSEVGMIRFLPQVDKWECFAGDYCFK